MRTVLIFKETLLPVSETFILAQAGALRRYAPVLAGLEPSHPSLALPASALLLWARAGRAAAGRAKLYRRWPLAPGFHARAAHLQPALIHAHFASGGRSALALARKLHLPLVVTLHGADVTRQDRNRQAYDRLGDAATLFLCVSEFIRERALSLGLPAEKLLVHSIGIDRNIFAPAQSEPERGRILFVGRLVEKKGCEYLLRAMPSVQAEHPEARLTVVGDGPLRPSLEALATKLAVRCEFLGSRRSDQVRAELARSRVFCAPSVTAGNGDSEGLGTVFAEAQAMGIPVVSSTHGGIAEIVEPGVTGLLVPERDHQALAASLSALLGDDTMHARFRRAALAGIESRFDLRKQTDLLEHIYDNVLATCRAMRSVRISAAWPGTAG